MNFKQQPPIYDITSIINSKGLFGDGPMPPHYYIRPYNPAMQTRETTKGYIPFTSSASTTKRFSTVGPSFYPTKYTPPSEHIPSTSSFIIFPETYNYIPSTTTTTTMVNRTHLIDDRCMKCLCFVSFRFFKYKIHK